MQKARKQQQQQQHKHQQQQRCSHCAHKRVALTLTVAITIKHACKYWIIKEDGGK